jgi:hypothetical protein
MAGGGIHQQYQLWGKEKTREEKQQQQQQLEQ